jgi:nucleotide-binding universal stress UspA family protein
MPRNIVVPADGSPDAEAAAWYAAGRAGADGTIHIVVAWEPVEPLPVHELAGVIGRRAEVETVLDDVTGPLAAAGLGVMGHVRRCGLVAALCAVAHERAADLIVVPAGWEAAARELRWRAGCSVDHLGDADEGPPRFRARLPVAALML